MNHSIILAAGSGERMLLKKDKLLLMAGGHPIIYYSLIAYNDHPEINSITVVANTKNKKEIEKITKLYRLKKVVKIITGEKTRQKSFIKGFDSIKKELKENDLVMVHNGANPLPSFQEISKVLASAKVHGASIVGHKITSTIKEIKDKHVYKTHDRNKFFAAETPQVATKKSFEKAIKNALKKNLETTDEAMMLESISQKIAHVQADENNFKITTQADYFKLKAILGETPEDFRVGIGQDSHVFENNKKGLVLAGVKFPKELKLRANSDGDVILHALFNAFSQAIGGMSIGFYADDICKKGITNSRKYLELILKKVRKEKFKINSVGIMMEGSHPRIDPVVSKLKNSLSKILGINVSRIGITATSGENCTVFGEGLGLQCFAIVSMIKEKNEI
ncbi:MAG: 2-C-methyl-D-erythritol 2,4-cyclodiphosphate synthase [Candidatus Gracilibacteria bacterium]|nr:2-C-methyl-D-erythritol 2,4-cyclodiphosphate synthase [Candidatus Gracilibacteria bacterium]